MPLLSEYLYGTCHPFAGISYDVSKFPEVNTSYVIWPKGWILKPLDSGKWCYGFYPKYEYETVQTSMCTWACWWQSSIKTIPTHTHTRAFTLTWLLRLVCRTQLYHQTYISNGLSSSEVLPVSGSIVTHSFFFWDHIKILVFMSENCMTCDTRYWYLIYAWPTSSGLVHETACIQETNWSRSDPAKIIMYWTLLLGCRHLPYHSHISDYVVFPLRVEQLRVQ